MEVWIPLLLAAIAVGLLVLLFKLLGKPLRWLAKLFINALLGFVALFLFNFFGDFVGLILGLNWFNAIVAGVLGVPGIVLLLLIKYIF